MLIKQDFILLILNCVKYREKALKQKETWLNTGLPDDLLYFHVIGNPNLETEYVFDNEDKVLYVKCEDDYNSLPQKVIKAYYAVNQVYNFKYIFKTDDDQNLIQINFFKSIIKVLTSKEKKVHYGGYIVDVKTPYKSKYNTIHQELPDDLLVQQGKYCSGRFYLLSNEAITALINKENIVELLSKEYLEDYAIGYHLPAEFKQNIMFIDTNVYFKDFIL